MSWEAIWTMAGVIVGAIVTVGLALTPFLWKMAVNSGRQTEAMEGMRGDIHEMKESFHLERQEMRTDIRNLGKRCDKQHERLVDHESRIKQIEKEADPTRKTWTERGMGPATA